MDTKPEIIAQIEAILFASGTPQGLNRLAKILNVNKDEILSALDALEDRYRLPGSALGIMRLEGAVQLATKGEYAPVIEALRKGELEETLSRATLETLAVIAYRAPVTRADIDAIRGVNSNFTLRHLLIRGLIEREGNPHDSRGYIYRPTFDFLKIIGVEKLSDLPEYDALSRDERLTNLLSENAPTGDGNV
jgi:segregation and condensation protein B